MKVLVTGIDGYIGSVLKEVLINRGFDFFGLDTGFYKNGVLYKGIKKNIPVITKDVRLVSLEDLKGFDAIIHLAELSNDPLSKTNPQIYKEINLDGSVSLAIKAKKAGVKRFIYSSSCSVYGIATEELVNEQTKPNPQTEYARCKVLVEEEVKKLASESFCPVFLRNATVFGASPKMRFDLVVNDLCGTAWVYKEIRLQSDGTPWRPLIHVLDVCDAFSRVLETPKELVNSQIINIGSTNSNYRIKEIAEIIGTVFIDCKITFGHNFGDTRSYRVSFEKIQKILPEFTSKRDVLYGTKELFSLFKKINLSKNHFESGSFRRLKELEYLQKTNQIDSNFFWN